MKRVPHFAVRAGVRSTPFPPPAAALTVRLTCGPHASAIPQCAIAHFGSSRAASWNEANGRAVVETVQKRQSLIEISLRLRRICRDLARIGTKPLKEWFLADIAIPNASAPRIMRARGQNVAAFINETL